MEDPSYRKICADYDICLLSKAGIKILMSTRISGVLIVMALGTVYIRNY
jgi:hypothetical protein